MIQPHQNYSQETHCNCVIPSKCIGTNVLGRTKDRLESAHAWLTEGGGRGNGKELVKQSLKVNIDHDMEDAHTTVQKEQNVKGKRPEPQVSVVFACLIWFISEIVLHGAFLCKQTVIAIVLAQHSRLGRLFSSQGFFSNHVWLLSPFLWPESQQDASWDVFPFLPPFIVGTTRGHEKSRAPTSCGMVWHVLTYMHT